MLGFDKTITIYHKGLDGRLTTWTRQVAHNVSWHGKQGVTFGKDLRSSDRYSVRILKQDLGRLQVNNEDVVILGIGPEVGKGITEITSKYTDCFTVSFVNTSNLSKPLPHLRIEGV